MIIMKSKEPGNINTQGSRSLIAFTHFMMAMIRVASERWRWIMDAEERNVVIQEKEKEKIGDYRFESEFDVICIIFSLVGFNLRARWAGPLHYSKCLSFSA